MLNKMRLATLVACLGIASAAHTQVNQLHVKGFRTDVNRQYGYVLTEDAGLLKVWKYNDQTIRWSVIMSFAGYQGRFSPDGRYLSYNVGNPADVWTYDFANGSHVRRARSSNGFSTNNYCWSPGSRWIYFNRTIDNKPYAAHVSVTTGEENVMFNWGSGVNGVDFPSWSDQPVISGSFFLANGVHGYGIWRYGQLLYASGQLISYVRIEPNTYNPRVAFQLNGYWYLLVGSLPVPLTCPNGQPAASFSWANARIGFLTDPAGYGTFVHGL